jgi:hypothetical protein
MSTETPHRFVAGAALVIGLLVVVAAVILGTELLRADEPEILLRRPAVGEMRPDYLPDGTPVWVMGHADGTVDVLSGFDTHIPFNLGKLLWWCPSAQALENPQHGSRWDEYGARMGGPAPAGLPSWDVTVRGGQIHLGSPTAAPPLDTPPFGPEEFERVWCVEPEDPVVFHTFDGWQVWDSPTAAIEAPPEGWILLEGGLATVAGRVHICALTGCEDSAVAANVDVPPPGMQFGPLGEGRFIARVREGVLVDVARVVVRGLGP